MDPCTLNVFIAALTNHFYSTLSREDFLCLGIIMRELSRAMLSTTVFEDFCCSPDKNPANRAEDTEIIAFD